MNRGDVVLVDWRHSDGRGSKVRPAVVLQTDALNALITDTVLVQITGTSRKAQTEVELDPAVETASGLLFVSYAVCNNLLTMDQSLLIRRMGALSPAAMAQGEAAVRLALGL